jgi:hypothetical protein
MKFSLTGEYTIQKVLRKKNDRTMARENKNMYEEYFTINVDAS